MAVEIIYEYSYDGYPNLTMITKSDGEVINQAAIDINREHESIPSQTLVGFSEFLSEQFQSMVNSFINEGITIEKYNMLVEPLRNICRIKNACDDIIYNRENPPENTNPWPPIE